MLCAEQDIPDHEHHQRIDWLRADPTLTTGLGGGWQASLGLPIDLRVLGIEYTTPDGEPYEPPYGDNHHRDEVLWGLTDGRAMLWRYAAPSSRLVVGGGIGTTLPFGRTEEDPFALAAEGEEHQHFQLGSGTFDPMATGQAILAGPRWGAWLSADARVSLYENRKGYRPPRSVAVSAGPSFRIVPDLQVLATADGLYETPETWDGEPYGGRAVLTTSAVAIYTVNPRLVLQGQGRATVWQRGLGDEHDEPLTQRFVLSAGASWSFGRGHGDQPAGVEANP